MGNFKTYKFSYFKINNVLAKTLSKSNPGQTIEFKTSRIYHFLVGLKVQRINNSGKKIINLFRITFQDIVNQVEMKETCLLKMKYL